MLKFRSNVEELFWRRLMEAGENVVVNRDIGPYEVDFFFPAQLLIVEIDGPSHGFSKRSKQFVLDMLRDQFFRDCGFRVIRVPALQARTFPISKISAARKRKPDDILKSLEKAHRGRIEQRVKIGQFRSRWFSVRFIGRKPVLAPSGSK